MRDWLSMSAGDLGRGIGACRIDPAELTETFLEAIGVSDLSGRIYARSTPDRARAEAAAATARARAGQRLSPLDGVPVSWKDLFDTKDVATEAGSRLLAGRVPGRDARVLRSATAQGLVCLGKTHMSELAFSGLGYNPMTATPPCANDPEAVSGGSSSGAAASVAFGLAAGAIGSDTGGSVRVPAAWNDLVGLKTTAGRVPVEGCVPLCARFDTIGPLARTVEDAALLLAALEGERAPDLRGARLEGTRLAVLETLVLDELEPEPAEAFERAVTQLEAAGAQVSRITAPEVAEAQEMSALMFTTEAYGTWQEVIEADPDAMYAEILARFRGGQRFSGAEYVAGARRLDVLRATWAERVASYDAVILPSVPILPPKLHRLETEEAYYRSANLLTLRNTRVGNMMGVSGLTLPTGRPSCGIMFLGKPMGEARLLRLGAAAERALG